MVKENEEKSNIIDHPSSNSEIAETESSLAGLGKKPLKKLILLNGSDSLEVSPIGIDVRKRSFSFSKSVATFIWT